MKKFFLVVLVSLVCFWSVFGQSGEPKDLVLVLDTSSSISDYSEEVSNYLIGPFLQRFLRLGDTFHLISFSDEPKLELSRRIRETGDVETIIARLLLMYPFVRYTDISSAIDFAESYTAGIPGNRSKRVVFITDGKNNALPGSVHASVTDDEIARLLGSGLASRFAQIGAEVTYVTVPLSDDVPGGRVPAAPPPVRETPPVQQTVPQVQPPARETPPAQQTAPRVQPPARETPPAQQTAPQVQQTAPSAQPPARETPPQSAGTSQVQEQAPEIPPKEEADTSPSEPVTAQDSTAVQTQVPDRPMTRPETRQDSSSSAAFFNTIPWLWILLILLAVAAIIGFIIFLMTRRLHSSPGKAVYEASNYTAAPQQQDPAASKKDAEMLASYAAAQRKGSGTQSPYSYKSRSNNDAPINGPLMLSLFVEDQNTAIGRRNIHNVKSGMTLTVGGGKSDFLMFLVPMPPHIAEVHFDGKNCTFVPKKPKLFPDIGSQPVPNCIGKTIRVFSEKNYELFIRIERFHDPLLELNRLMNSIKLPGLPESD